MALIKPDVWRSLALFCRRKSASVCIGSAVSAADPRTITFAVRQLQRKFKHAADFGVTGKYSRQQATRFERAMRAHVEHETTMVIPGTYRE
jgi:hypothetical protein